MVGGGEGSDHFVEESSGGSVDDGAEEKGNVGILKEWETLEVKEVAEEEGVV